MATLKHDAQGFLKGDPIELGVVRLWNDIRADVKAIRKALAGAVDQLAGAHVASEHKAANDEDERSGRPSVGKAGQKGAEPARRAIAYPLPRDDKGRFVSRAASVAPALSIANTASITIPAPVTPSEKVAPPAPVAPSEKAMQQGRAPAKGRGKPESGEVRHTVEVVERLRRGEKAVATPGKRERDKSGRFKKGDGKTKNPDDVEISESAAKTLASRLSRAVLDSGSGMEEVDPAVKAFNEVAQPLAKGYELMTGGSEDKKQTGLLRRIFTKLHVFHKEETALEKANAKTLKAIEGKSAGDGGGEGGGVFGKLMSGLAGLIPGFGLLTAGLSKASGLLSSFVGWLLKITGVSKAAGLGKSLLSKIPGVGRLFGGKGAVAAGGAGGLANGAGGAAKGAGRASGGVGKRLGGLFKGKGAGGLLGAGKSLGKGFLKKIPLLGTLLGGLFAWNESNAADADTSLTTDEKNGKKGEAWGGAAGGAIGAAIGTVLLGPLGTIIGGLVGDWLGGQLGEIIGTNWQTVTEYITKSWDSCVGFFKDTWTGIGNKWNELSDWIGDKWGKAKEMAGSAVDAAKEGYEALKQNEYLGPALQATENAVKKGVDVAGNAATAVKDKAVEIAEVAKQKTIEVAVAAKDKAVEAGGKAVDAAKAGANYVAENTLIGRGAVAAYEGAKTVGGKVADRWNDAKQYLLGASDKAGVDAGAVAKIAHFESGFNSDAAPIKKDGTRISSAHGYGQFIDGTWTEMVNKYGAKYGVEGAGKLTKEQAAKYRDDKVVQAGMLAEFTRENIEKGRKYGGGDDDANVYAFHNLGDKDARGLLSGMKQNPAMTVREALLQGATSEKEKARIEQVISGNKSLYGDGRITASDAYERMGKVMRRGEVFAADARESLSNTPVVASAASIPSAPAAPVVAKAPAVPVIASASAPSVPAMPAAPVVSEAPPMIDPMATSSNKTVAVSVAQPDVGQDVRNRAIAHIKTGGIAA